MATPIPTNHARFTLAEVAEATGGELHGDPTTLVHGVFLDSRRAQPDGLFLALRGETFDGHAYANDVDAAALIVERLDVGTTKPRVVVASTLEALGALAQYHRLRWGGPVVTITGSVGKTTTKNACVAALSACGLRVRATEGNLNNLVGAPMSVLTLDSATDVGVFEIGTSEKGEIEALTAITLPNVGVVTSVGAAHTAGLGSVEAVAVEKLSLVGLLEEDDHAILNADDAHVSRAATEASVITFGTDVDADIRLDSATILHREGALRRGLKLTYAGGEAELSLRHPGRGATFASAAAFAVALALKAQSQLRFDGGAIARALEAIVAPEGRMQAKEREGVLWLDDAYNASPLSVRAALEDAAEIATVRGGRAFAVLGDMLELGSLEADAHNEVVAQAKDLAVQSLFFGAAYSRTGEAALTDIDDLVAAVKEWPTKGGDVVLVKGSRSMRLERVVSAFAGGSE